MKPGPLAVLLASCTALASCAYLPAEEGSARRVSPDYAAAGSVDGVRASVYGNRTLLEFDRRPVILLVRDESGASVAYERLGRHYRLARRLDKFTAWVNGRPVTFSGTVPARTAQVFSGPIKLQPETVTPSAAEPAPVSPPAADLVALLALSARQRQELRQSFDVAGKQPMGAGASAALSSVQARLNDMEARLVTASAATVQVKFPLSGTAFKPGADVAAVLVASARSADRVTVRGHTDARVAGPKDPAIALGRALAARAFLIGHGVPADKITVSSQADGGFVAPHFTAVGRALNRRVEIEFADARIAGHKSTAVDLVAGKVQ